MTSCSRPLVLRALLLLVSSSWALGLSLQGVHATGGHADLAPAGQEPLSAEHDLHGQARKLVKRAIAAATTRLSDKARPGEVAETPATEGEEERPMANAEEEHPAANASGGRQQQRTSDAKSDETSKEDQELTTVKAEEIEEGLNKGEEPNDVIDEIGKIVEEETGAKKPKSEADAKKNLAKQLDRFLGAMGMKVNEGKNEIRRIFGSVIAALIMVACCFVAFSYLRMQFPQVYAMNCVPEEDGGKGTADMPPDTFFGWIAPAWRTDFKSNQRTSGMDAALQIEMYDFATNTVAAVALPLICILCPLHYYFGKMRQAYVQGTDPALIGWISSWSLNNIADGSWLVWVHAVAVWYVVLVVELQVFRAMNRFMPIRFAWLQDLKPPRSTTLLVENIPEEYCSDESLKDFFNSLFPDCKKDVVDSAYVIKKIPKLNQLLDQYIDDEFALQKIRHELEQFNYSELDQEEEEQKQALKEKESEMLAKMDELAGAVEAEQARILEVAKMPMVMKMDVLRGEMVPRLAPEAKKVQSTNGFISFTCERIALTALSMRIVADGEHFVMSIPPHADDIIYEDLNNDMDEQTTSDVIGWLVISLLFYAFIPTIIFLARILRRVVYFIPGMRGMGLRGVLSTLPLQIYLSFLPTVLFLIFNSFFSLKSAVWGQKLLQSVYFVFNVIFTLLITAVVGALSNYPGGQMEAAVAIIDRPSSIPALLAASLPYFSQFYIDFLIVRWTQHCLQLTRYVVLAKFIFFRYLYGEDMALEAAEPEDQDFYGMGARYARAALDIMVWLVFSSISPLIGLAALVNCVISRICYGYLLICAETRKHDLGGPFFVTTLHQVHCGLLIYIILMTGVLAAKGGVQGKAPSLIAASCLIFLGCSYWRFCRKFRWESLPFAEVVSAEAIAQTEAEMEEYRSARSLNPGSQMPGLYRQWQLFETGLKQRHHEHHHHTLCRMHSVVTELSPAQMTSSPRAKQLSFRQP